LEKGLNPFEVPWPRLANFIFTQWVGSIWDDEERADVIKSLSWPEDEMQGAQGQDRSVRAGAQALGLNPDQMVANAWEQRQLALQRKAATEGMAARAEEPTG